MFIYTSGKGLTPLLPLLPPLLPEQGVTPSDLLAERAGLLLLVYALIPPPPPLIPMPPPPFPCAGCHAFGLTRRARGRRNFPAARRLCDATALAYSTQS